MHGKSARRVLVTGATGYLGRSLVRALVARGHQVVALVRPCSEGRMPEGATAVRGNPLELASVRALVAPPDTFVHLVGVSKPSPWKASEFERVDLGSALVAIEAARVSGVRHFVYVSVAQPAPVMQAYVRARARAETALRDSGLPATILRPWYVLGPAHRWPIVLLPAYALLRRLPWTREGARRLGFVTLREMTAALVSAVEDPARDVRVLEVPEIRELAASAS